MLVQLRLGCLRVADNGLQISEGTNRVGFSEEFGLLLMCCYTLFVLIFCAVGKSLNHFVNNFFYFLLVYL
jgi:hypothetical protein